MNLLVAAITGVLMQTMPDICADGQVAMVEFYDTNNDPTDGAELAIFRDPQGKQTAEFTYGAGVAGKLEGVRLFVGDKVTVVSPSAFEDIMPTINRPCKLVGKPA